MRALIIVDVQNDFCEGGSLPVTGGAAVAGAISGYLREHRSSYAAVAGTLDWHVEPGNHFAAEPDYVTSWPVHCVAGGPGARTHPGLDTSAVDAWFLKGAHAAAYSGFEGSTSTAATAADAAPADEAPADEADDRVGLAAWLRARGVDEVDVVGLATDHCVRATALDAVAEGFRTRVLLDLAAGVAHETTQAALTELSDAGVELVGGGPAAGFAAG